MTDDPFYVTLKNRGLIHVEGPDRAEFLQGLITNDIHLAGPDKILYACLLTPQGKFLFDFFIHDTGDAFLLDCEGGERVQALYKKLLMYRLRADVQISVEDSHPVYAIFGSSAGLADPRHAEMGRRSFEKPEGLEEKPFEEWDKRRVTLTIPDGARDMISEKSTMDEVNMEGLNGVSFDKGCYVGQELTARMKHRGLGKRHLKTVMTDNVPEGAELRSSCGDIGIALVRNV